MKEGIERDSLENKSLCFQRVQEYFTEKVVMVELLQRNWVRGQLQR